MKYLPGLLFVLTMSILVIGYFSNTIFISDTVETPQKPLITRYNLGYSDVPGTYNITVKIEYTKTAEFTTLYTGKIGDYNRETMEFTPSVPVFWRETENFDMIRNKIRNDLQ